MSNDVRTTPHTTETAWRCPKCGMAGRLLVFVPVAYVPTTPRSAGGVADMGECFGSADTNVLFDSYAAACNRDVCNWQGTWGEARAAAQGAS